MEVLKIASIILVVLALPFVLALYFILSRKMWRGVLSRDNFKPRFELPYTAVVPADGGEVKRVEAAKLVMRDDVNTFAKERPVIIAQESGYDVAYPPLGCFIE